MSERKVLSKYYPPDFDPSAITRTKTPKDAGPPKLQTIRLMAPFSMKCTTCGEYIYKGRKFNARKETLADESYYNIKIIRFYIRCTRCSAELTFKTDPKNNDYQAEKGIRRNFEVWREAKLAEETEEERLDRLEREEVERDPMKELEQKTVDAKMEMEVADKLDEIRTRNARVERAGKERDGEVPIVKEEVERALERQRLEREDEEAARLAFQAGTGEKVKRLNLEDIDGDDGGVGVAEKKPEEPLAFMPAFVKAKKRKQDFGAALGIKKKKPTALV